MEKNKVLAGVGDAMTVIRTSSNIGNTARARIMEALERALEILNEYYENN